MPEKQHTTQGWKNDPESNTSTLKIILGDQLNYEHSWFKAVDDNVVYTLMEIRAEQVYVMHHIQKIAGFFAAMRAFAQHLSSTGHRVHYIKYDNPENAHSIIDNIRILRKKYQFNRIEYLEPDEYRLDQLFKTLGNELDIDCEMLPSEHFLTQRKEVQEFFKNKKTYLMESFYRHMRRKHHILMQGTEPMGGQWNFDHDNRKKYKGEVSIPPAYSANNNVSAIYNMICKEQIPHFGAIDAENFHWPINRKQALEQLHYFLQNHLVYFGTYEDAMTTESATVFHSQLSFAMNLKMISPIEIVHNTLSYWSSHPEIKIQQVEGFIRQIIGWREFMRGIYWAKMPHYENLNYFENEAKLPSWYWTGNTKMNCLKHAIKGSLKNGWAHHIQRLMVTGNFAALIGADPNEVDNWYLGIYVDAIQWVEITNTRGMSQFADGGLLATKPYVSSASYMHKMSDYCTACSYKHQLKTEEYACPFNSLYWDYFHRNREKLERNPRIGMMYRVWDKMKNQEEILNKANQLKTKIESL
ncbi:cryptochrome/photolyase family protein [bacterium]|nr:cryptochrome/photolyase family protein [bacterium]